MFIKEKKRFIIHESDFRRWPSNKNEEVGLDNQKLIQQNAYIILRKQYRIP